MSETTPKLGKRQAACLESLQRRGIWPGNWVYDTHAGTKTILDSLVKKGLVVTEESTDRHGSPITYYRPAPTDKE